MLSVLLVGAQSLRLSAGLPGTSHAARAGDERTETVLIRGRRCESDLSSLLIRVAKRGSCRRGTLARRHRRQPATERSRTD